MPTAITHCVIGTPQSPLIIDVRQAQAAVAERIPQRFRQTEADGGIAAWSRVSRPLNACSRWARDATGEGQTWVSHLPKDAQQ